MSHHELPWFVNYWPIMSIIHKSIVRTLYVLHVHIFDKDHELIN